MTVDPNEARWEVELRNLREELRGLRAEQKELGQAVRQLLETFRALATHLGVAVEPYGRKGEARSSERGPPGFA
jgi:predicted  nucleic acid-binding Zn-ribbon protein